MPTSPRATGPVSACDGSVGGDVAGGRGHERGEQAGGGGGLEARRRRHQLARLALQRDEEVAGRRGGQVVERLGLVGQRERAAAEAAGEPASELEVGRAYRRSPPWARRAASRRRRARRSSAAGAALRMPAATPRRGASRSSEPRPLEWMATTGRSSGAPSGAPSAAATSWATPSMPSSGTVIQTTSACAHGVGQGQQGRIGGWDRAPRRARARPRARRCRPA